MDSLDGNSKTPPNENNSPNSRSNSLISLARATPAGLGMLASRGRWKLYPHLKVIHRKLLDVAAYKIPRLMILLPPQHGKSELVSKYLPAWYLGTFPDRRIILSSYEHDYAASWGRKTREILEEHGDSVFGVKLKAEARSQDWFELVGRDGAMYSVGAGGAITGKGAELILLDDLLKNTEQAMSDTIRENIWDWYKMTVRSRLHDPGAIVLISTRWHEDDPPGRLLKAMQDGGDRWEVVKFPAIAEEEETWRDSTGGVIWTRKKGEALCPELYSLENLRATEKNNGPWIFATQYQQSPFPREAGGFFKRSNFEIVTTASNPPLRCRGWDFAATPDGDWTVGLRLAKASDGETLIIEDIIRGRWAPGERDSIMRQTAGMDPAGTVQVIVQDPGQAGLDQAERQRIMLAGYPVDVEAISSSQKSKLVRAHPVSSYASTGRIKLLQGEWNAPFLGELEVYPNSKYDDQCDALATAFGWIIGRSVPPNDLGFGKQRPTPTASAEQGISDRIPAEGWSEDQPQRARMPRLEDRGSAWDAIRTKSPFGRGGRMGV
jgi:predicted phage terminase large subunit-like protein